MKRVLSGAVAVVLIVSSSGAGPEADRAPRAVRDRASLEKRLDKLDAQVRANRKAIDRLVRNQGRSLVVPPDPQTWIAPTPRPFLVPGPDSAFVPDSQPWIAPTPYLGVVPVPESAPGGFAPRAVDRCLIRVDGSAFDAHFVVKLPEVDSRIIVAPKVTGLPAGSWPYRPARR